MTPQYSTIRRFDLLCVLKDFSEEYSGDVDTGGIDLNVGFSIVGENPDGAKSSDDIRDLLNTNHDPIPELKPRQNTSSNLYPSRININVDSPINVNTNNDFVTIPESNFMA